MTDDPEQNEKEFNTILRHYLFDSNRFQFGGVVNLLGSACTALEEKHQETGLEDYKTALDAIEQTIEKVDLSYE
jgi:hypothetical protein